MFFLLVFGQKNLSRYFKNLNSVKTSSKFYKKWPKYVLGNQKLIEAESLIAFWFSQKNKKQKLVYSNWIERTKKDVDRVDPHLF